MTTAAPRRTVHAVAAVLVGLAALSLLAVASRSGRTPSITAVSRASQSGTPRPSGTLPAQSGRATPTTSPLPAGPHVPAGAISLTLLAWLVATVYLIGFAFWLFGNPGAGRRWRWPARKPAPESAPTAPERVTESLVEAVDTGLRRLPEGAPRDAVVACWVLLERAAAQAGVERRPAETSAELTARVLDSYEVNPAVLNRLASLYREARYSRHRLDEDARRAARSALEQVRHELAAAPR